MQIDVLQLPDRKPAVRRVLTKSCENREEERARSFIRGRGAGRGTAKLYGEAELERQEGQTLRWERRDGQ